jgi:arylsulfatase A-like enzyme
MFRAALVLWLAAAAVAAAEPPGKPNAPPNVVIMYCDDLGYSDIGPFGAQGFETPNLDRLAHEGRRFTSFYSAQAVCSASRAALLTGCYPNRIGILGALNPKDRHGISDREMTIGNLLKSRGYATAIIGKWHLGHHPQFLPTRHGFDEYFGLPYSNDMGSPDATHRFPNVPLIEGEKTIENGPDQSQLTTRYTERAVDFIDRKHDLPFFLYVAQTMPHVPLYVSEKFKGKSAQGMFGDVVMEIDWSVGQILDALDRYQLADRTLVIFTSDNGPWLIYGNHGGSARPLREGKMTSFDGGVREPCVMRWPGHIPADTVCDEPVMTIDLLPTIAHLAGADVPGDRVIDGRDIWPLMAGEAGAKSPHEALYYYWGEGLQAVRAGRWKLHFPHAYSHVSESGHDGKPGKVVPERVELALYDLETDRGETTNVAADHPDVVAQLQAYAEKAREDLGDKATNRKGANLRPAGRVDP